tara:strand:- start:93 stop:329 length:237 start_codon:yes stop_codon:yes gene_type:complete
MTRQATDKILEMVEQGILDKDTVIMSCLKYMSEDDVADMAHSNEFFINEEDEDDDEPEMEDDPEGLVDIIPDNDGEDV